MREREQGTEGIRGINEGADSGMEFPLSLEQKEGVEEEVKRRLEISRSK